MGFRIVGFKTYIRIQQVLVSVTFGKNEQPGHFGPILVDKANDLVS